LPELDLGHRPVGQRGLRKLTPHAIAENSYPGPMRSQGRYRESKEVI
jgi:hypothetical protein